MADNPTLPATGTGTADLVQATDDCAGVHYPKVKIADGTADSTTMVAVGDGAHANALRVAVAGVAHDSADAGNPVKIGFRAVAFGATPTAVAAADRTDWLSCVAGIPFVLGGHPNILTLKHTTITTAVTDAAIITAAGGTKLIITRITVTLDNASTVFPSVLIGLAPTNTPTTTGVIASHGGVPAGGGFNVGDGSGIIGVGADGDDLRVTTVGNATGNGLHICVSYFTIAS